MVVWLQCQNCGSGRAGKNSDFKMEELPEFDESIRDRFNAEDRKQREEKHRTFQEELQNKTEEWFQKYNEYLSSPHWYAVRRAVLNRDRLCQSCFSGHSTISHHLSYATYSRSGFSFPP